MKLNLYKDYYITSCVGDSCYTLKTIKTVEDKESKSYGKEVEQVISYPVTIENALKTVCNIELLNSKITTWDGYLKEIHKLQDMIRALAKEIGADDIVSSIVHHSKEFLSQGDSVSEEPKKRGRKKKE